jgi:hypothetical protein
MPSISQSITETAVQYGVDPQLALAVANKESGLEQAARGTSGEVGVFQLLPGTATDLGVNPYDLAQNIQGGVRYLAQLLNRYGDPAIALAAYNGGPGNMDRGTVSSAAWAYAQDILSRLGLTSSSSSTDDWTSSDQVPAAGDIPTGVIVAGAVAIGALILVLSSSS